MTLLKSYQTLSQILRTGQMYACSNIPYRTLLSVEQILHKHNAYRASLFRLEKLQASVMMEPYSVILRGTLADAYRRLGYPDLAVGEAYKALLLIDEICEESAEYHDLALEAARRGIAKQTQDVRAGVVSETVGAEVADEEVFLWAKGPFSEISYAAIVGYFAECGCLRSSGEMMLQMLRKHPHLAQGYITQENLERSIQDWHDSGRVRRELYPWNPHEPERCSQDTLTSLNEWISRIGPKLEVRTTELPLLSTDASRGV